MEENIEQTENTAATEDLAIPQEDNGHGGQEDQDKNWRAVRDKLSKLENENETLKYQINAINQGQSQTTEQSKYNDDDLVTVGQMKNTLLQLENQYREVINDIKVKTRHQDYDNIVTDDNVRELVRDNPELREAIRTSNDPRILVYNLLKAKMPAKEAKAQKQQEAQQVLNNMNKPGALGNAPTGSGTLNQANRIKSMNDREFEQYYAEIKRKSYQ